MRSDAEAMVALMGATGTGKSTFIHLLTGDDNIHIGHDLDSKTFDVDSSIYIDEEGDVRVTLLDTPGFDDSHEGVSDTDILGKIANFLQDGGGRKFNGIIYLHRISDPRFSGTAKKNLRIFRELCGDDKLDHIRFVTTYWNVVSEKEGKDREAALANGVFKPFLDAGAKLIRHDGRFESAKKIVSDVARKTPVRMKIQEELNTGMALGDTSAGAVVIEEMKELQKKHENEMEELKKELEEAANGTDENLRAELDEERRKLEEKIAHVEEDRRRLATMRMNLDQQSQQNMGNPDRAAFAKHEKALGEARPRLKKDKGLSGEQMDTDRKDKQSGGGKVALAGGEHREQTKQDILSPPRPPVYDLSQGTIKAAEVALAGGEHREQTKQDIRSPPRPPVHDLSQGTIKTAEVALANKDIPSPLKPPVHDISQETRAKPEKIQEGIQKGKAPDGDEWNNYDKDRLSEAIIADEKRWEEVARSRRSPVHNRPQDTENVNGEWMVYCIFMISLVAVVFAAIQSE